MMKLAKQAKAESRYFTTPENSEMDNVKLQTENDPLALETFELEKDGSIVYDTETDENSPAAVNVVQPKGLKRKANRQDAPIPQEVVQERQGRKKQKTPLKSMVHTDSEMVPAQLPSVVVRVPKTQMAAEPKPRKRKMAAAKASPSNDEPEHSDNQQTVEKPKANMPKKQPATRIHDRTNEPSASAKISGEKGIMKIKIPFSTKYGGPKSAIGKMLDEFMTMTDIPRKGVSLREVKHYLATTFNYHNITVIKLAIKARLTSGEYVKTTGVGLTGKFKPAPKKTSKQTKKNAKRTDSESATPSDRSNVDKGSKAKAATNVSKEKKAPNEKKASKGKKDQPKKIKKPKSDSKKEATGQV